MTPKCGFCNGTLFRLVTPFMDVQGARFKMPFVICSNCNAAIAVMSQHDAGIAAKAASEGVASVQSRLTSIESEVRSIRALIQNLR